MIEGERCNIELTYYLMAVGRADVCYQSDGKF